MAGPIRQAYRTTLLALTASLALSLTLPAGAVAADYDPAAFPPESKRVNIGTARDPNLGALIIVTKERGLFEEAGLDVEVSFFPSGGDLAAAVVGGSILIGSSGSTPTTTLRSSPFPIRILARQADISGAQQVIVDGPTIPTIADFAGKRVGYMPGTGSEALLNAFLGAYDLDKSSLKLVSMGPSEMVAAFVRRDVDAISVWETHASRARIAGNGTVLHTGTQVIGKDGTAEPKRIYGDHSTLFATEDFIASHPNTIKAILFALSKGAEFIEAEPVAASEVLGGVLGMEPAEMLDVMRSNRYTLALDRQMVADLKALSTFLVSLGRMQSDIDPMDWIHADLLREVRPDLVNLD